jgi:hypothetical protein
VLPSQTVQNTENKTGTQNEKINGTAKKIGAIAVRSLSL